MLRARPDPASSPPPQAPVRAAPSAAPPPPLAAEQYPLALLAALLEMVLILLAAHGAYYLRFDTWVLPADYLFASMGAALLVTLVQMLAGTYVSWRGRRLADQLLRVYAAWLIATGLLTLLGFALKLPEAYSRLWFGYTIALAVAQITVIRTLWALALRRLRVQGRNLKNVVLLEWPGARHSIHARLPFLAQQGYHVQKQLRVDEDPEWLAQLGNDIAQSGAHEVWICLPLTEGRLVQPIAHALRHQTVEIRYFPELGDIPLLNHRVHTIAGLSAVDISCSPMTDPERVLKRLQDLLLGGVISVLILPVCLVIALAVRLSSPGPVLFKQKRLGRYGQAFNVYKFRTMAVHQETDDQVTPAQPGDPRITRVGAFLRRTSLDELPQFFNVLRGDMSIVGPRPHALAHNDYYKELVESYMKRHKMKPGITGWAQVNGYRGLTDTVDKMQKRVEYDLWYINNWSLALDLRIIARTIVKGFVNWQP